MKGIFTFSLLLAMLSSSVTFADPHQPATNPSQETSATHKGIPNATVKDKWCVFNDALGEPIPAATVKIFDTPTWKHDQPRCIATVKLDERGRLKPPASDPRLQRCCFVVSHPDYGTALAEPRATMAAGDPLTRCTVPLVRIGARADKRSIWGTVVDTQANPVKGALLTCTGAWTLDGARIPTNPYRPCRTITNDQGKFAIHIPLEKDGDNTSGLIPVTANYNVHVEAPRDLCLRYWWADVPSGQETTITLLPAPSQGYFPTFVFEDEFGPVTDPDMLEHIEITIKDKGNWLRTCDYNTWIETGQFTLGTYYVTADWNGGRYVCEPVDLTQKWPDTVVFKMKSLEEVDVIYQGQVVHGVTGQPVPEAIIMSCREGADADVSHVKPEQWDAIHSSELEFDPNDTALVPLKETFRFTKITRTDAAGRFYIVAGAVEATRLESFVAIEKNYLGAEQYLRYFVEFDKSKVRRPTYERFEPDENGYVTLPPMKLFPAGTIVVEPNIPEAAQYDEIRLSWFTYKDDTTPWLKDLWAPPRGNKGGSMVRRSRLQPNKTQTAYVAAGIELTIEIYMLGQSQSEWAPVVIRGVRLQQGQVLDLGRLDFHPNMKVAVKVIDSKGQPVPGLTVWLSTEGAYHGPKAVTTQDGTAAISVPPYSKGVFAVVYYDKLSSTELRESVPYEVGDENDAGRQFTLQLSNEMISRLFE